MKLKYLFITLLILLFSNNLFSQNLTVEISLEKANFWQIKKLSPLNVKITNESDQLFDTDKIQSLIFYFSKCSKSKHCGVREDKYIAQSGIPKKSLKKGENIEVKINLADLILAMMLFQAK